jgi:hypothetical protein
MVVHTFHPTYRGGIRMRVEVSLGKKCESLSEK